MTWSVSSLHLSQHLDAISSWLGILLLLLIRMLQQFERQQFLMWWEDYCRQRTLWYQEQSWKDPLSVFWTLFREMLILHRFTSLFKEFEKESLLTLFLGVLLQFRLLFQRNHLMLTQWIRYQGWWLLIILVFEQFFRLYMSNIKLLERRMLSYNSTKNQKYLKTIWMSLITLQKL